LLFGVLRTWSRSVIAPILAHTATNSLAYVAAILAIEVID
jgi:membrane protease YdiL (CAAX protease family)